jgi:glucose-6-phosphate 1-dehydrogenase
MSPSLPPVEAFDLVVFGGTGDLALRKLMPALYYRDREGELPPETRVIGLSRKPVSDDAYREIIRAGIERHVASEARDEAVVGRFLGRLRHLALDARSDKGWKDLAAVLAGSPGRARIYYLATSPDLFALIPRRLGEENLITPASRLVLEKPIGRDLKSARAIHDEVCAVFDERQVFRIDHYLGKETVQNLMALRFANALFEPVWSSSAIDHVQITVAETVGVEGRAAYYDAAGALRDVVQNHMMQVLCLLAMEPPRRFAADDVHDEKIKVLKSLRPLTGDEVAKTTVRGQYIAGAIDGGAVPGFVEEIGRPSDTETYAALKVNIDNWRWAGVPFYLRTGKRLPHRVSEIVVQFRAIPHSIFGSGAGRIEPNRLVMRLQPNEGVELRLMSKDPRPGGMRLKATALDLCYAETFKSRWPEAYERLLFDVVRGDATLFMRRDEVEAAWAWIDPILAEWRDGEGRVSPYTAGSWGPPPAVALMARDGRTWVDPGT